MLTSLALAPRLSFTSFSVSPRAAGQGHNQEHSVKAEPTGLWVTAGPEARCEATRNAVHCLEVEETLPRFGGETSFCTPTAPRVEQSNLGTHQEVNSALITANEGSPLSPPLPAAKPAAPPHSTGLALTDGREGVRRHPHQPLHQLPQRPHRLPVIREQVREELRILQAHTHPPTAATARHEARDSRFCSRSKGAQKTSGQVWELCNSPQLAPEG